MSQARLLYSRSNSKCCGSRSVVVRSREGGFVTQNCEQCGKPRAIRSEEFPKLKCAACQVEVGIVLVEKNYAYKCSLCGITKMVHTMVPSWEDRFSYHGYAIPGVEDEFHF